VTVDAWRAAAERDTVLWLPRIESHPAGMLLGYGCAAGGFVLSQVELPGREIGAWLCLAGLMLGMLLHWRWKKSDTGWRIDFERRSVAPVGVRGEAETLQGGGWSIQTSPGEKRATVAIDLRHQDRGRVARLLDVRARRKAEMASLSALADTIARRLNIARTGPQL
jgi:hypothetical protein